jgi:hypothetical protein
MYDDELSEFHSNLRLYNVITEYAMRLGHTDQNQYFLLLVCHGLFLDIILACFKQLHTITNDFAYPVVFFSFLDVVIMAQDGPEDNLERGSEESHGYAETQKKRSIFNFRHRNALFEGWKFTIFLAFIASLTVLFFNIGFVLYSPTHNVGQTNTILYEGDCEKAHRLSIGFHLLISKLSTVLLGASNFGMVYTSQSLIL